jgi:multiple antibiotic resistance protein
MLWQNIIDTFVTLLIVIDPPGIIPPFLALTVRKTEQQKKQIAARAIIISGIILVSFTVLGDLVLNWLKISLAAFSIAGGLLLFRAAFNMVLAQPSGIDATTQEENKEAQHSADISTFPLAIPLIAGPGSIASVILLSRTAENTWVTQAIVIGIVLIVLAITYVCLKLSNPIVKLLGVTGTNVIGRIFGIILAALSIQFILTGIEQFIKPLL